jgi:hypothetical protein
MHKRSDKDHREQIKDHNISHAAEQVYQHTVKKLEEKGQGTWLSRHEILGIITEECDVELKEAVHSGSLKRIKEELLDLGCACQFAIACIDQGTLDW